MPRPAKQSAIITITSGETADDIGISIKLVPPLKKGQTSAVDHAAAACLKALVDLATKSSVRKAVQVLKSRKRMRA